MSNTGSGTKPSDLSRLYEQRFSEGDLSFKRRMWQTLCSDFFQRYVKPDDTVLDLGAGTCEFINSIECGSKIVVDANPDVANHAKEARVVIALSTDMSEIINDSVDVVFASNFFEHLPDKGAVMATLRECRRILKPSGKLLTLMPNIRYLHGRYWDYFDHYTPLSHLSLQEALSLAEYKTTQVIPRFLPYTVKSRLVPESAFLVKLYLRVPLLWPIFGKQMFLVAVKPT